MDKVEAIKRIKDHIRVHHIGEYPHIKIAEALNIAISALENDNNVGHKVEGVHGQWIHVPSSDMMTGKAYKCSECGKMRYGSYMPNYCQCCGAKMDGDGNG